MAKHPDGLCTASGIGELTDPTALHQGFCSDYFEREAVDSAEYGRNVFPAGFLWVVTHETMIVFLKDENPP